MSRPHNNPRKGQAAKATPPPQQPAVPVQPPVPEPPREPSMGAAREVPPPTNLPPMEEPPLIPGMEEAQTTVKVDEPVIPVAPVTPRTLTDEEIKAARKARRAEKRKKKSKRAWMRRMFIKFRNAIVRAARATRDGIYWLGRKIRNGAKVTWKFIKRVARATKRGAIKTWDQVVTRSYLFIRSVGNLLAGIGIFAWDLVVRVVRFPFELVSSFFDDNSNKKARVIIAERVESREAAADMREAAEEVRAASRAERRAAAREAERAERRARSEQFRMAREGIAPPAPPAAPA